MKVLIISHMYPSNFNRMAGIFVYQQAKALVKNGCEVKVISPVPWTPFPIKYMNKKWRKYSIIPFKDTIGSIEVYYPRYLEFPHGILFYKSGYFMGKGISGVLKKVYSNFKFDIIHSNVALPDGYSAMVVNRYFKVPNVVTIHGQDFQNTITKNNRCKQAVFEVLNAADGIITVSSKLKNMVKDQKFYNKIRVINNGIDVNCDFCNSKRKDENVIKILSVSNLKETKGIHINLEVLGKLKDKYSNVQYDIIGSGDFEESLKKLVKKLNLEDKVNFLGRMEHKEVIKCMSNYDIFSLPSYNEGFGVAYIEAMSVGLPVIGVKGEGIEDVIVNGKNGFLVERENVESLYSTLDKLIQDKNIRVKVGLNGKSTVEKYFTWDKNAQKVIKLYDELI
ncbi:glycosyltransferase [Clostridium sp. LBM24168]